jgi:hypothetical protein
VPLLRTVVGVEEEALFLLLGIAFEPALFPDNGFDDEATARLLW